MWIGSETGYDVDIPHPRVVLVDQVQMELLVQNGVLAETYPIDQLHAFYNTKTKTIYLRASWRKYNQWDRSVLLHELLHHVQTLNGVTYQCIQQMEEEAWPLQKKYLKDFHNYDWEYDLLWYLMISTCPIVPEQSYRMMGDEH